MICCTVSLSKPFYISEPRGKDTVVARHRANAKDVKLSGATYMFTGVTMQVSKSISIIVLLGRAHIVLLRQLTGINSPLVYPLLFGVGSDNTFS